MRAMAKKPLDEATKKRLRAGRMLLASNSDETGISERAHAGAHLGAEGANASYPVSFQLEPCLGDCGSQSHELPVPVVRRQREEGTGEERHHVADRWC